MVRLYIEDMITAQVIGLLGMLNMGISVNRQIR